MPHKLYIALLVIVTVLGGGCCSTVPKRDAASVPPIMGDGWPSFYDVAGEVGCPGRQLIGSRITLLKAIAYAGGFTPSANKKKVQLTRHHDGERRIINCASA